MMMFRTALRTTALALAIAAATPTIALADATLSIQGPRHSYVYYRDHDIYYAPETRTYYWMADGNWRQGERLPDDRREYVRDGGMNIELDTDRPYERHAYVTEHYRDAGPTTTQHTERTYGSDGSTRTTTTTTSRSYVYYGDHDIYYAPETRVYYWRSHGQWRSGAYLPRQYRGYVRGGGVNITLDTDRPYERHDYVVAHYRHHNHRHGYRDMRDDQREYGDRRDDRNERHDD